MFKGSIKLTFKDGVNGFEVAADTDTQASAKTVEELKELFTLKSILVKVFLETLNLTPMQWHMLQSVVSHDDWSDDKKLKVCTDSKCLMGDMLIMVDMMSNKEAQEEKLN